MTELQYPVPALTDRQRDKVREFYEQNPKGGYKSALQHAGIHVTKAVAQATINGDEDLADLPYHALRVDRQTALAAIGDILADPDHKDRLRAATFALAALHGMSEKHALELTGAEGGAVEVTVQHDYGRLLAKLEQVGLLHRGPSPLADAAAQPLLPARTD